MIVATYDAELYRDGPGLLLDDILDGDPQVEAVAEVIAYADADILHLTGFDWDLENHALTAFARVLADQGAAYPYFYASQPNTGVPSGVDLDGNGRVGETRDSFGYGSFTGQGGMAILSRYPIGEVRDFSQMLWAELPDNPAPRVDGLPFPSEEASKVRRLSSVAHWDVPIDVAGTTLHLLAWHGSTPVFDGPEDLNGARGADEAMFWIKLLNGSLPFPSPEGPVVLTGISNIDPVDGDGRHVTMARILRDPLIQDPMPTSAGGSAAANPGHAGDPALDTADFDDPLPGNLRVDYVLPDARLRVLASGVVWPAPDEPMAETVETASRHRLVWVEVDLP
ncbi:endonuclease/exonuclease/phosphatase family protein [Maritimibacter alexandrii]|uniref:endonuclease/exonuclease/phosphatase family protein n=1 Tax=Maritimibacter alexandrii TaxID=2570355 RepID=UPI00110937F8|nr:endonuclease/exonuclease/phosphatase family protein [Maritimibacter alexandrii]